MIFPPLTVSSNCRRATTWSNATWKIRRAAYARPAELVHRPLRRQQLSTRECPARHVPLPLIYFVRFLADGFLAAFFALLAAFFLGLGFLAAAAAFCAVFFFFAMELHSLEKLD